MDCDGLLRLAAVASIVRCREGAHDDVVARGVSSDGLARHFNGYLTTVVRRRGVVHGHLVGALYGVVRRH